MATKVRHTAPQTSITPLRPWPAEGPATELDYTVLPVSALKKQHAVVFDTLKAGKTVYVANRGRVVAAFRPASFVPEAVAASYTSPYLDRPAVNARDLGRGSVSKAVDEARQGLPSIVVKDGSIYGILTPATTPEPPVTPDMDAIGAKAEAMRQWREDHPEATIDEVVEYSRSLDLAAEVDLAAPTADRDDAWSLDGAAAIDELQRWKEIGSDVEDTVQEIIADFTAGQGSGERARGVLGSGLRNTGRPRNGSAAVQLAAAPTRATLLSGERAEAAGHAVQARTTYVEALTHDRKAKAGAAFALANLARTMGNLEEAAVWYRMALQPNLAGQA